MGTSVLVGTQVPQFENSNFHYEDSPNFVIEACEYKRSFLQYRPYITVITNIDLDHLDYYKNLEDYISAFQSLVDQTSGYVIISADDENSRKLHIPEAKKIVVGSGRIQYSRKVETLCEWGTEVTHEANTLDLPSLSLQVPGEHLLQDAHLAYTVARLLGMQDDVIVSRLESYRGSWRRSEIIRTTEHGNILMSDYGHHPNEIRPTLRAIREKYRDKNLFVIFQPHQYSRTRELLAEFATAFADADTLIIPNIYFSRDKQEDVEWMTTERLIAAVKSEKQKMKSGSEETVVNGN